jgi:hypothetical protein
VCRRVPHHRVRAALWHRAVPRSRCSA